MNITFQPGLCSEWEGAFFCWSLQSSVLLWLMLPVLPTAPKSPRLLTSWNQRLWMEEEPENGEKEWKKSVAATDSIGIAVSGVPENITTIYNKSNHSPRTCLAFLTFTQSLTLFLAQTTWKSGLTTVDVDDQYIEATRWDKENKNWRCFDQPRLFILKRDLHHRIDNFALIPNM